MKWKNTASSANLSPDEEHVLILPEGIIGFEEFRRYVLVNDEDSQAVSLAGGRSKSNDLRFPPY